MTTAHSSSPTGADTGRDTPARSLVRVATYVVAVLGLGSLGPLVDRAGGQGPGEGPGRLINLVVDPTRWIIGPGIDGVAVIAACGVVGALLLANTTD